MKLIVVSVLVLAAVTVTEAFAYHRIRQCPPCPNCPPLPADCIRIPYPYCKCCPTCFVKRGEPCSIKTERCEPGYACTSQYGLELGEVEDPRFYQVFNGTCRLSEDRREDMREAMENPYEPIEQPEMKYPYRRFDP